MKRGLIFLFISLVLFININAISASFEIGSPSHSIEKQYAPLSSIKGWINISLSDEPSDSLFETNFGSSIFLMDLLDLNSGYYYDCIPTDCETGYSAVEGSEETGKNFNLNFGQSKVFGFKITGEEFVSANDFSLNVTSDASEYDYPQLFIDILADLKLLEKNLFQQMIFL